MNQLSKIIVGAITVWIGIYLVVYLIFVLSGDDTSLAEETMKSHLGVSRTNYLNVLKRDTRGNYMTSGSAISDVDRRVNLILTERFTRAWPRSRQQK